MQIFSLCFYLILVTTLCSGVTTQSPSFSEFILQQEIYYSPCGPDTFQKQTVSGETIFSELGLTTKTTQTLTITAWFMLKGMYQIEYPLVQIQSNNQIIFQISYVENIQLTSYIFKSNFLFEPTPAIIKNIWTLIKVNIQFGQGQTEYFNVIYINPQQTSVIFKKFFIDDVNNKPYLDRLSMEISIGKYQSSSLSTGSCALVREVVISMTPQTWDEQQQELKYNLYQATSNQLYLQADFLYLSSNPSTFLIQGEVQFERTYPWVDPYNFNSFSPQSVFNHSIATDEYNLGYVVYFDFLIPSQKNSIGTLIIFEMQLNAIYKLQLNYEVNNGLLFDYPGGQLTLISGKSMLTDMWYQCSIIVYLYDDMQFRVFLRDQTQIQYIDFNQNLFQIFTSAMLDIYQDFSFGNSTNTQIINFDNIRIYKGAHTFKILTTDCYLQLKNKNQDCLICNIGFILDEQDNMSCIKQSEGVTKSGILNWSRQGCSLGMIHQDLTSSCSCLNQHYYQYSSCFLCPEYCDNCSGPLTCLISDPNRIQSSGICQSGYFDDSQSCISRAFSIPNKNNVRITMPPVGLTLTTVFYLRKEKLHWQNTESFFIGFSFSAYQQASTQGQRSYNQIIAFVRDGVQSQFLISVSFSASKKIFQVCFYYIYKNLVCYWINPLSSWVGLWADDDSVLVMTTNLGYTLYERFNKIGLGYLLDPTVCVGACTQDNILTQKFDAFQGKLLSDVLFINNVNYSDETISELLSLNNRQASLLYYFDSLFTITTSLYVASIDHIKGKSQFNFFSSTIDPLLGFYHSPGINGLYSGLLLSNKEFSFSLNIKVMSHDKYRPDSFFGYQMNGWKIQFLLSYNFAKLRYGIRICYDFNCKETTNCPRNTGTFFIGVFQKITDYSSQDVSFYEYDIVCNFRREKLLFYLTTPTVSFDKQFIKTNSVDSKFYINNLRFFKGSDFYFDYSENDHCLIYYDLTDMKCLKAKEGYVTFKGKAILLAECISTTTQTVILNAEYQECIAIEILNAPADLPVQCPEGYFYSLLSATCEKCHQKCSSCAEVFDQCTKCVYPNTLLPNCGCSLINQYQNIDFECINCSPQCGSCRDHESYCLTCSDDRISPPNCMCSSKYDKNQSNSVQCIEMVCSGICQTCEDSPTNCTSCHSSDREIPNCTCKQSLFEVNSICQPCKSNESYSPASNSCIKIPQKMNPMDVSLTTLISGSLLQMTLNFEEQLDNIDFNDFPIDTLIDISLEVLSEQEIISIINPFINKNILQFSLKFRQTVSQFQGYLLFIQPEKFKNKIALRVLNGKYNLTQFNVQADKYIFQEDEWIPNSTVESISDWIIHIPPVALMLFRQLSVMFYFLNTLQPCVFFLMVKIKIPPNLFEYLRVIGLTVFPDILLTQDSSKDKQNQDFAGISLQKGIDYSPNSSTIFDKFILSNSILVNIPVMIAQIYALAIVFFGIRIVSSVSLKPISEKYYNFIVKKINSSFEAGLLLISTAIFNQFFNRDQTQYFNRTSFYLAFWIISFQLYCNFRNFQSLSALEIQKNGGFKSENPYLALVEKLDFERRPSIIRLYWFSQLLKKYLIAGSVIFFQSVPSAVCTTNAGIFLTSMFVSIIIRPYKSQMGNIAKILGEMCLAVSWLLFLCVLIPQQKYFQQNLIIPKEESEKFLRFGLAVIILLMIFKILYLLELIWVQVILKIKTTITAKKEENTSQLNKLASYIDMEQQKQEIEMTIKPVQEGSTLPIEPNILSRTTILSQQNSFSMSNSSMNPSRFRVLSFQTASRRESSVDGLSLIKPGKKSQFSRGSLQYTKTQQQQFN